MEATWLPTAIRGGGRHESHDDVTATMATGRRGQYVSLPELGAAVPSARSWPHHRRCIATNIGSETVHRVPRGRQSGGGEMW